MLRRKHYVPITKTGRFTTFKAIIDIYSGNCTKRISMSTVVRFQLLRMKTMKITVLHSVMPCILAQNN